jgi:hypothetical protein
LKVFNYIKAFPLLLGFTFILCCCRSHGFILDEKEAREMVKSAVADTSQHNVVDRKEVILKSRKKAIKFCEKILFDIYGRREIKNQRPYEVFNIDGYWLVMGTLPKGMRGGTFLMIVDSHNYRIVRIIHYK